MSLRVGYACLNTQLPSSARTLRLANATPDRLRELIASNLDALDVILRWNAEHGIEVFRLTSNLIPFASHPVNELTWWAEFGERFRALGEQLRDSGARISIHPGQFVVLSSQNPSVVSAAVDELSYHGRLLDALELGQSSKIVLHVGAGTSTNGASTLERFAAGFALLPASARMRLVVENDERWPLERVLELSSNLGVPVVLDVFHHSLAPSLEGLAVRELVQLAARTWATDDGRQEVHFSTQAVGRRPGAHAETLDLVSFAEFVEQVGDLPLDCILEVKDKEQSVLRAQRLLAM